MSKIAIVSPKSRKLEVYAAARQAAGEEVVWCDLSAAGEAAEIVFSASDPRVETDARALKIHQRITIVGREASDVEIEDSGKAGKRPKGA